MVFAYGAGFESAREENQVKFRRISRLLAVSTALAAVVLLAGCPRAVKTPISFAAGDLTLTLPAMVKGTAIAAIVLPEASGGEGAFSYALAPEVPGLTFDPETRQLSGTPTTAGSYPLRYTATAEAGDAVTLSFTVTVRPTLWGSWRNTRIWYYDEEEELVATVVETLTFTNSRYIVNQSYYRPDGSYGGHYEESGTWTASDDTVTKTWYHDDDDDGETPEVLTTNDRDYVLSDEGNTLLVPQWTDNPDERLTKYVRAPTPDRLTLIGTWTGGGTGENNDGEFTWEMKLTFSEDGSFNFLQSRTQVDEYGTLWTGSFTVDPENLYIMTTFESVTSTMNGVVTSSEIPPELETRYFVHTLRWAFAPTGDANRIVVSTYWEEQDYNVAMDEWVDRIDRPYGNYWLTVSKDMGS